MKLHYWLGLFTVAFTAAADEVRLADLDLGAVRQGWGAARANQSVVDPQAAAERVDLYPPPEQRVASPGGMCYRVDPERGDDSRPAGQVWRSLSRLNGLQLAAGDRVEIAPGQHDASLVPAGGGTAEKPIEFHFGPGRHDFPVETAVRLKLHISNNNDKPDTPKPIGLLVREAKHLRFRGEPGRTLLVFGGRMIMFVHDRAEDIVYAGLQFDLKRPTVSEFRVLETADNGAVIQVAEGSEYAVAGGALKWLGDLGGGWTMVQQAIPAEGRCWRMGQKSPLAGATAEDLGGRRVRLTYAQGQGGLIAGRQFQFRNIERDCVGGFNTRSRQLAWRRCDFFALTGLGLVSQFSEDLAFEQVKVAPPAGTLRTCPAWGDMFHFSGCRGLITVSDCVMSGSQDDPINVHGTHLRLIEKTAPAQVLVRFMHPQTYGFAAFQPGDAVEFVGHDTLRAYASNIVRGVERKTDKDWLLTLEKPAADFAANDVIDNVSWYPDLEIRNCHVTMDATRGFLITTRGRVVVESNTFQRTTMSAIDIADDANSWFESGPVRDVTIRGNRFLQCGEPVVRIAPENRSARPEEPVHAHIRILDNLFDGGGISAKSVTNLVIAGNRFTASTLPLRQEACSGVHLERNQTSVRP